MVVVVVVSWIYQDNAIIDYRVSVCQSKCLSVCSCCAELVLSSSVSRDFFAEQTDSPIFLAIARTSPYTTATKPGAAARAVCKLPVRLRMR